MQNQNNLFFFCEEEGTGKEHENELNLTPIFFENREPLMKQGSLSPPVTLSVDSLALCVVASHHCLTLLDSLA